MDIEPLMESFIPEMKRSSKVWAMPLIQVYSPPLDQESSIIYLRLWSRGVGPMGFWNCLLPPYQKWGSFWASPIWSCLGPRFIMLWFPWRGSPKCSCFMGICTTFSPQTPFDHFLRCWERLFREMGTDPSRLQKPFLKNYKALVTNF